MIQRQKSLLDGHLLFWYTADYKPLKLQKHRVSVYLWCSIITKLFLLSKYVF